MAQETRASERILVDDPVTSFFPKDISRQIIPIRDEESRSVHRTANNIDSMNYNGETALLIRLGIHWTLFLVSINVSNGSTHKGNSVISSIASLEFITLSSR